MGKDDEFFMKRAFFLAEKGKYHVAPNPMVGAVITHKGKIIGEGYHQKIGEAHAEVNAIASVVDESLLKESTLYVNLEPCSHFGKTPPCADLIIEKKIRRIVVSNTDPSDKVAGKGIERLRKSGAEVTTGVLEKEGERINKRFIKFHSEKRPYITLKWALTQDGFIGRSESDPNRDDNWITSELSKQLVHQWRAEEMGILIGKNTALNDNPELTVREFEGNDPIRFLIDPNLECPLNLKLFNERSKTVVINSIKNQSEENIDRIKFDQTEGIFPSLFNYCRQNQIHSLFIEGGSNTLQHFIEANMWDEARVFHGQKRFGSGIKGPISDIEPYDHQEIRGDQLYLYKNPKN